MTVECFDMVAFIIIHVSRFSFLTFRLADFLGSFFTLVANVVTDLVGKITKDYNGLNLKRLALFRFKTRGIFLTYTLLSNRTDSKISFFPKEGVDETLSIELQLWRCKRLSLHKEEKKNDRKNEKKKLNILYKMNKQSIYIASLILGVLNA